jgi:prevent-host-death family protein
MPADTRIADPSVVPSPVSKEVSLMSALPYIIPVSELRRDAAGVIKRATETQEPVFVTQHGRATAVLVDAVAYQRTHEELALLRRLMQGEAEIEAGATHPLEEVLARLDALLKGNDLQGAG